MLFPKFIYKVKKNKNLGDIKCVEVKRVFCIKREKKKHIDKKKKWKSSDLVSTTVEFVPKRGWGGVG